jgi:hypothetical protein
MLELQKAVKTAEMKANELVTTERIKMERRLKSKSLQTHRDDKIMLN